jgi:hypothetical protein
MVVKTVSPGLKLAAGLNDNVLPLTVAVPAFFPPACALNTLIALEAPLAKGALAVTVTLVVSGAATAFLWGVKPVTVCPTAAVLPASRSHREKSRLKG